jgi:hypothetical protein
MLIRAAFYIDGFNAYHTIADLQRPHLKWLDWQALASILIPSKSEALVKVCICTAVKTTDLQKQLRHRAYLKALEHSGVECLRGHFANEERRCNSCGAGWRAPVEKQGDVNLALTVLSDAHDDVFDHCYLVTADSDQAATARMLKAKFPNKRLTTVVITGREHSKEILSHADAKITIRSDNLERALFPKLIAGPQAILRPKEYDPPGG